MKSVCSLAVMHLAKVDCESEPSFDRPTKPEAVAVTVGFTRTMSGVSDAGSLMRFVRVIVLLLNINSRTWKHELELVVQKDDSPFGVISIRILPNAEKVKSCL
jgi:hypothetical protein